MDKYKMNELEFKIPRFDFDHPVADLILDLEKLREPKIKDQNDQDTFIILKKIFHILESVGSARIEGNNTTIADYVLKDEYSTINQQENWLEINNIELILNEIDEQNDKIIINHNFIKNVHSRLVNNLNREGSKSPGNYRTKDVLISGSKHVPPSHLDVFVAMDKLINFINELHPPKYDLLKIAIAHHGFVWIHPFDNGNGRTVRVLTYALLIKLGYQIDSTGRVINPTAIFCSDRSKYYAKLEIADKLDDIWTKNRV